ncbi:hypothetical protein NDU88_004553 [Pleurodeles waltl]|uniref:Uncharacterized protein n=1 Tax=Pleurodeles waltl TaxID=8319 RepID=A0AAV7QCD3_PLEWA|nr:hypothetical protein NDU88_004553 [Pleurodeles waltl]
MDWHASDPGLRAGCALLIRAGRGLLQCARRSLSLSPERAHTGVERNRNKWVEASLCAQADAITVARKFLTDFVQRFGIPLWMGE